MKQLLLLVALIAVSFSIKAQSIHIKTSNRLIDQKLISALSCQYKLTEMEISDYVVEIFFKDSFKKWYSYYTICDIGGSELYKSEEWQTATGVYQASAENLFVKKVTKELPKALEKLKK